jgi:hypothetical protein
VSIGLSPGPLRYHAHTPPNMALEATGHSVRFLTGVSLYRVARASAWALCRKKRRLNYESWCYHANSPTDRQLGSHC